MIKWLFYHSRSRTCTLVNNSSGICKSCEELCSKLKLSQFKEEPTNIPAAVEEEEQPEENVSVDNDEPVADSDPEYYPGEVLGKPTEIKSGSIDENSEGGDDQKNELQREGVEYLCDLCHYLLPYQYIPIQRIR